MAWKDLKAAVAAVIKTNGTRAITGALLQSTLSSIIDQVGANATFKGVATPATTPGTPDGPVFYLAYTPGVYSNFGGVTISETGGFVLSNLTGSWSASKVMDAYSKTESDAMLKGVDLGTLIGQTSYSDQEGIIYLSRQTSLNHYDVAYVDTNHVDGTLHFVQYRGGSGTYSLINSTPFVDKIVDISSFVFQPGDWIGTLLIGSSSGGVKWIASENTTIYKTGGFFSVPSIITGALTGAFNFAIKLSVFSEVDKKIEANNDYFYDKSEVDGFFGSYVSGESLGSFEGTQYPYTSNKNIYLSRQIQNPLEFNSAKIKSNHSDGIIHFVQYRESSGTYSLINSAPFVNNVADVSSFVFQIGDWIGTWLQSDIASGGVEFAIGGGLTLYIAEVSSLPNTILNTELTSAGFRFSFMLVSSSVVDQKIEDNNSNYYEKNEVDSKINSITSSSSKRVGKVRFTNFRGSNFPAPWTNIGFTPGINGMQSPITGGIDQMIEYDQYSNLDSFITMFRFNMVSASNVLLTNYHKKLSTSEGHVVGFDLVNGLIRVYSATVKGIMPSTVLAQFSIPFTIVMGETSIRYERNAMLEKYTIVNGSNSYTAEYDSQTQSGTTGGGYDKFGLVFLSGCIIVQEAHYHSQLASEPDILILGDSIVNGDTIRSLVGGGYKNRWSGIVSQRTSVSIASLGGNTVTDINRDLPFYFSLFKPERCIYGVGINDSVLATFTAKADEFITTCEAAGIEPILQTLFPRGGREVYCEDVSNWVKSRGTRYIDFRRRMTVDGLGVIRKPNVFLGDNLHPNILGHSEMAKEVIDTLEL